MKPTANLTPTTRGVIALCAIPLSAVAGSLLGAEELVLVAIGLGTVLACGLVQSTSRANRSRGKWRIAVSLATSDAEVGSELDMTVTLVTAGAGGATPVWLEDPRHCWARVHHGPPDQRTVQRIPNPSTALRIGRLAHGETLTLRFDAPTSVRGIFSLREMRLWCFDTFGLVARQVATGPSAMITVHPVPLVVDLDDEWFRGERGTEESQPTTRLAHLRRESSGDFSGLRPYVPGDRLRLLYWPALARRGELLVRDFEDPGPLRVHILADVRPLIGSPGSESVLATVAGVGLQALARDSLVELATTAGERVAIGPGPLGPLALLRAVASFETMDPPAPLRWWDLRWQSGDNGLGRRRARQADSGADTPPRPRACADVGVDIGRHHCGRGALPAGKSRLRPGGDRSVTTVLVPPRAAANVPQRRRQRVPRGVSVSSFAPLLLSLSVALALARLMADGGSARVLVPVVVAMALADVVTALAARLQVNFVLAVAVGWAIAVCGVLLMVDPSVFDPASSHFLHASVTSDQLRAARAALADDGTPLPALNGIVIILGAIGAGAAALTRGIWVLTCRRPFVDQGRGPLAPCLAPSVAIFLYTTLVSAERSRVPAFVSYFLGLLVFVALVDRATTTALASSLRHDGPAHHVRWRSGGVVAPLLASLIVIAAGTGLSTMRLTVFHVSPPSQGAPGDLITGIALVDHLLATEITESRTVIFHDTSPVTTYWQVGTLSSFNGTDWLPSAQVRTALSGSAGELGAVLSSTALPTPTPAQTFTARVTISDFESRLLPAPPGTLAVHGLAGATAIEEEGVLAGSADITGTSYTLTAPVEAGLPTGGRQLSASDPRLTPYLALPTEPAVVARLARQAVGKASTPAAQAQALVDWFRSGRFRYTLSPPPTTGANPLVQFLTVTKAGFCEQFAGAYGVLARSLGIPTRLVVGFTAGKAGPNGTSTVTGADAHVWPQVYLGPEAGWVSVEPTPVSAVGTPPAEGVVGQTTPTTAAEGTSSPTTSGASTPPATTPAGASPTPGARADHRTSPRHRAHAPGGGMDWWWIPLTVAALLLLAGAATWTLRRRRAGVEALLGPDERVVQAWERAQVALRGRGVARRPAETPAEFASRLRVHDEGIGLVDKTELQTAQRDAVASLAGLVELACYTPRPCTPAQAARAHALASTIVAANRSHRARRSRRQTQSSMVT